MELPTARPSKQARVAMALKAVSTVDAVNGAYRMTTSPHEKEQWMREVWEHPQVHLWCAKTAAPTVHYHQGSGTYRFSRNRSELDTLHYAFGKQPMTDTELAKAFADGARFIGWPDGARTTSGIVYDPQMLMLSVMAMWVHNPGRAKELHDLYGALKLTVVVPVGGWDPTTWAAVL